MLQNSINQKKSFFAIFIMLLLFVGAIFTFGISPSAQAAEPILVNQCNGFDNVGGQSTECDVTVVNNLNQQTGTTSSTLTIRECHGAANAEPTCVSTVTTSTSLITQVTQCNGSGNGGGSTVTCNVNVRNNIIGNVTPTNATVNQCNASGTGGGTEPTIVCDPTGSTTNATVDQCNASGTGGGDTLRVRCTVDSSTQTSILPVSIDQCNSSGNGGGGVVICSTSLVNRITAPTPTNPTPTNPTPTNPTPTNPTPTNPTPTNPTPTNPTPTNPTPTNPTPTNPTPTNPTPTNPTPTNPTPTNPTPTNPTPTNPTPTNPTPTNPTPTDQQNKELAYTGFDNAFPLSVAALLILMSGITLMLISKKKLKG